MPPPAPGAGRVPERTAYRPGVGTAVENRAKNLGLARAGVTMLANVTVEAERAVVTFLDQAFAVKKVNGKDCGVPAIATSERQRAAYQIAKHTDRDRR